MTISRVELQGQIARAQDYTNLKHNEDNNPTVQQNTLAQQNTRAVDVKLHHVNDSEQAENRGHKFDASEEGQGQYSGDGGKKRKDKKDEDGKVLIKGKQQGFDLKI